MTVGALVTELGEVVNGLRIRGTTSFAEVASWARDGPYSGAQAVVRRWALLADILALLILILSWRARHCELVTRASRALVAS